MSSVIKHSPLPQNNPTNCSKLAENKSPSHDLITNKILKNFTLKALFYLINLLHIGYIAMHIGIFLFIWRHVIIIYSNELGKLVQSLLSTQLQINATYIYINYPTFNY